MANPTSSACKRLPAHARPPSQGTRAGGLRLAALTPQKAAPDAEPGGTVRPTAVRTGALEEGTGAYETEGPSANPAPLAPAWSAFPSPASGAYTRVVAVVQGCSIGLRLQAEVVPSAAVTAGRPQTTPPLGVPDVLPSPCPSIPAKESRGMRFDRPDGDDDD